MPAPERNALDHLAGMPPYLMMQMEARLFVRVWDTMNARKSGSAYDSGLKCRNAEEARELARWCLHRMMEKRINDGRQFDSILEASRKAFAHRMFAQALGEK